MSATTLKNCILVIAPSDDGKEEKLKNTLIKFNYEIQTIDSIHNLEKWIKVSHKFSHKVSPKLFITDLAIDKDIFNEVIHTVSEATILYVDYNGSKPKEVERNSNIVKSIGSIEGVIDYITTLQEPSPTPRLTSDTKINKIEEIEETSVDSDMEDNVEKKDPYKDIEIAQAKLKAIAEAEEKKIEKVEVMEQEEPTAFVPVTTDASEDIAYEENPYYLRARNIQKQVFTKQEWEEHRMIGIWSPIHRTGVTSLTFNFAFFLAQNRIYTAVLEGLTNQHAMKDWLKRYTPVPPNWISYAKAIQSDSKTIDAEWKYRNVLFLPLDKEDSQYKWHSMSLDSYMTTTKIIDVTLVDMPTGEMASYTKDSLHYLDELWIVVDDAVQETLAWKDYIYEIEKQTNLPVYLVFNKQYPFSQNKRLAKELELPLIASLPSLHEETMQNYYEDIPLYFKDNVKEILDPAFTEMASHLFKGKFKLNQENTFDNTPFWSGKLLSPMKQFFKSLKPS